jgi:hypothetical protein
MADEVKQPAADAFSTASVAPLRTRLLPSDSLQLHAYMSTLLRDDANRTITELDFRVKLKQHMLTFHFLLDDQTITNRIRNAAAAHAAAQEQRTLISPSSCSGNIVISVLSMRRPNAEQNAVRGRRGRGTLDQWRIQMRSSLSLSRSSPSPI